MRWLLVSTAVLVTMLGCKNNAKRAAYLELMNAERRALEDELYELEYDYETTVKKLDESRQENEQLRSQLSDSGDDFLDLSPSQDDRPGDGMPGFELTPPTVEPGVRASPPDQSGSATRPQGPQDETVRHPVSLRQRFDSSNSSDHPITHIYIDPALTKSSNLDRRPGDDGIKLVIEPRDDSGAFVPQAGDVSVVLLDYANRGRGEAARVARWDLDAGQTEQLLFDSQGRRGIHLELPWPSQPPDHSRLRLDVRFTTADGRQLETRQDISVNMKSESRQAADPAAGKYSTTNSRGWTPRSANRAKGDLVRQPSGQQNAGPRTGSPWSLEQAAGDAIRQDGESPAIGNPVQQSATRPEWRPYR